LPEDPTVTSVPPSVGVRTYAREIERRWARLQQRPRILSPKEWALICDWYARAVPLQVIEEAMQAALDKSHADRPPRTLVYLAASVEEAWEVLVDGRRAQLHDGSSRSDPADAARIWQERLLAEPRSSPLKALLERLLEDHGRGADPVELDARLDAELPAAISPDRLARVRAAVAGELEPFVERISAEVLAETARTAMLTRLRRELGLARLAPARG
ncbi:MAG TPA: hypothetical protein VD788_10155, partial [Candidatus Polarisedimenticolaceae bacterium]|nr:hypothetical protein [Candidatus Polarisedimenticolaceae bacterium]